MVVGRTCDSPTQRSGRPSTCNKASEKTGFNDKPCINEMIATAQNATLTPIRPPARLKKLHTFNRLLTHTPSQSASIALGQKACKKRANSSKRINVR
jgi:hypothetical protein